MLKEICSIGTWIESDVFNISKTQQLTTWADPLPRRFLLLERDSMARLPIPSI